MLRIPLSCALLAFALSACMRPDYERPAAPVASAFPGSGSETAEPFHAADLGWREFFREPRLQALIAMALEHNRDLRQAALRIDEARALYRIQAVERLPRIGGTASAGRQRTVVDDSASTSTRYEVGLSLFAFELDFFGRIRSLKDAALHRYLATEAARQAARIALIGTVASTYLGERALTERLLLAGQALEAREAALRLVRQRLDAGAASAIDLRQSEILVEDARIAVAILQREQAQALNALTLLVGRPLVDLPEAWPLAERSLVAELPAGLPSDLLVRRPDIRSAEHQLIAANAEIGAARAAFFPRISLTAGVGTASSELSNLFSNGTGIWSFVPQMLLPIFPLGANRANVDLAEARKELGIVAYERSIQVAFREVADALVARAALDEQIAAQLRLLNAERQRVDLAEQRYRAGVASFLEVLDARRETFDAEQALVQARQLRLVNAVDLYRALGGGVLDTADPGL